MIVQEALAPLWWDALTYCRRGISGVAKGRLRTWLGADGQRTVREPSEFIGSVVTVDGIRMAIDRRLSETMIRRIVTGIHTSPERRLVLGSLEPDDVIMELGAGVGMVSIACAQLIGSGRVFAYEANPSLQSMFRENCRLNGVSPQLVVCMLGSTRGERTFHIAPDFADSSVHEKTTTQKTITVPVRPFSEEVARIRPNFLIVDIEGAEEELLQDARLDAVTKMMLEVHPHIYGAGRANAIRKKVRSMGFVEKTRNGRHCLYRRRPVSGAIRA